VFILTRVLLWMNRRLQLILHPVSEQEDVSVVIGIVMRSLPALERTARPESMPGIDEPETKP
jgi:hypothetical protein